MSNVLVQDLEPGTVAWLEERARQHGRSLELEAKVVLDQAARAEPVDVRVLAARMRRRLTGRTHTDSAELLRVDRER